MDNGVVQRSIGLGSLNLSLGFGDTWSRKYEKILECLYRDA